MDTKQKVGQNIKLARKQKNITQEQIAKIWNMQQTQYSRYERGLFEYDYNKILSLCAILDITPNDIFDGLF